MPYSCKPQICSPLWLKTQFGSWGDHYRRSAASYSKVSWMNVESGGGWVDNVSSVCSCNICLKTHSTLGNFFCIFSTVVPQQELWGFHIVLFTKLISAETATYQSGELKVWAQDPGWPPEKPPACKLQWRGLYFWWCHIYRVTDSLKMKRWENQCLLAFMGKPKLILGSIKTSTESHCRGVKELGNTAAGASDAFIQFSFQRKVNCHSDCLNPVQAKCEKHDPGEKKSLDCRTQGGSRGTPTVTVYYLRLGGHVFIPVCLFVCQHGI